MQQRRVAGGSRGCDRAVHAAARADAGIAPKPAILRCAKRRIVLRSGIEMGDISVAADDKYMP